MTIFNWKRKFFDKTARVFNDKLEIGKMINESFSDSATVKIENDKFRFYKPDRFSRTTLIKNSLNKEIIGKIRYDLWKTKAYIKLNNNEYSLKNDSFWRGKWSLSDKGKKLIEFESKSSNGTIRASIDNDLLIFAGLYITNNYQRGYFLLFFVIILIPIIMRG